MDSQSSAEEVVSAVKDRPDIAPYARIVGVWVWIEFPDKPTEETRAFLKSIGFRWNKERGAWQHSCGIRRPRMMSGDPRFYYGMRPIEEDAPV